MKWVSYTRTVSCRPEEEIPVDIIAQQNEHIQKYAKEHGWKISAKYSDRKNSPEATEAFRTMQQDGVNRSFDGVITDSIFRCGCDIWAAADVLHDIFYKAGIHFAIVEDDFCSLEHTEQEIQEYFDGKVKIRHIDNAIKSMYEYESKGFLSGRNLRYGYKLSDDLRTLLVDREAALVIRKIFELYLEGKNCVEIARQLEAENITPAQEQKIRASGKEPNFIVPGKWHSSAVDRILHNPLYMGEGTIRTRGRDQVIHVEPIVSREVYDKVQQRTVKRMPRKKSWQTVNANILNKRIYDKKTGLSLMCSKSPFDENKRVYSAEKRFRYFTKEDKQNLIPYEEVMSGLIASLKQMKCWASRVDKIITSGEADRYCEAEIAPYREAAKKVFNTMNELYLKRMKAHDQFTSGTLEQQDLEKMEQEYQSKLSECEMQFQEIMKQVRLIKKTYSVNNPWLVRYRDIEVPEELNRDHIRKWIGLVMVEDYKTLELIPKEVEWRDRLPKEWFVTEMED